MAETWQITADLTEAHFDEAMRMGDMHQRRTGSWVIGLWLVAVYGLGALGGTTLVLAIADGDLRDGVAIPPGLATLAFTITLGLLVVVFRLSERKASHTIAQHRLNEPQSIKIGPEGLSFEAPSSTAFYAWRVVDAVLEGPEVIAVLIATVVIPLPKDCFADRSDAQAALAQMRAWQEAAQ